MAQQDITHELARPQSRLRKLVPVMLAPLKYNEHAYALDALRRVLEVRVSRLFKQGTDTWFGIEVHIIIHNIPTHRRTKRPGIVRLAGTSKRMVSEFGILRDEMQQLAQTCACSACKAMTSYFSYGPGRPLAFATSLYGHDDAVCAFLDQFMKSAIDFASTEEPAARVCGGLERIATLIKKFLNVAL